ncbi:MAG TPA: Gfo/Idh/MocA family oxidoreductase [Microlunatus sp.]|nr:Gfo/Idh/MocA family oxidoreductase [Microlunatus sp.]
MTATGRGGPVGVGVVGFGLRASLARAVVESGLGEVTAVHDPSERGRADARRALGSEVPIAESLDALLASGVEAIMVLSPDDTHRDVAVAALRAGVPVFCEKPLATTIADCDDVLQTAYETRTRLYVGHNMRHMPVVRQLRDVITSGRIGTVRSVWCRHFVGHGGDFYFRDWHADRRHSTGLLLQKGAHDLDVIHWLSGGYTRRTSAMGRLAVYGDISARREPGEARMTDWYDPTGWPPSALTGLNPVVDVEDLSMMLMALDNGVLASYEQCHFTPDYWRSYTVIGDAGRVENFGDGPGGRIAVWDRRQESWARPDTETEIAGTPEGHGGADAVMIAEFLRFVRTGEPTETSPVAAREAVAAGVTATESLRGGGSARTVPELDPDLVAYFEGGQA